MKWTHLSEFVEGKGKEEVKYLTMQVNHGKTGRREVIAGATTRGYFESIQRRFDHLKGLPFDQLVKVDEYIFRLPDGSRPKDLHGAFNRVLDRAGLKEDPLGRGKPTLYSLRQTYATHMLVKHPNIHLIAKNMGTSIEMLERHYSHAEVRRGAKHLAQLTLEPEVNSADPRSLQMRLQPTTPRWFAKLGSQARRIQRNRRKAKIR